MKLLFLLLVLTACVPRVSIPTDEVRAMCKQIVEVYPEATLQDVYKTCYQDFFGAEHLMQDTAAARKYLQYELSELRNEGVNELVMPMREPTGFRHRFERINLALVINGTMNEEALLQMFVEAAGTDNALHDRWADEWSEIERVALEVQPAWQNEELQNTLQRLTTEPCGIASPLGMHTNLITELYDYETLLTFRSFAPLDAARLQQPPI